MTKEQAIQRINQELAESGNGNYTFETARDFLGHAYREAVRQGEDYVFVKPPSGYEVEILVAVVKAALGA